MTIRPLLAVLLTLLGGAGAAAQSASSLQQRVDALVQQIQLRYQHFPPALEAHRAATEKVLAEWNRYAPEGAANASGANAQKMSDWLDAALRAVMPGGSGQLPGMPEFEEPEFEETVVNGPSAANEEPAAELPELRKADRADKAPKSEVTPTESPVAAAPRARLRVIEPAITTIENPYVVESATKAEQKQERPLSANPLRRPRPLPDATAEAKPAESLFVGPRATAKPVVPAPEAAPPKVEPTPRSKWSRHPSAAPLEWRDPFTDDPSASPNPLRTGARRQALRPEFPAARSTRIDLRQLAAEVRGYNAALKSLQSAVTRLSDSDARALAAAGEELGQLEERRQFLELYLEGLSPRERQAIPELPSMELVRELVRRKTESLSRQAPQGGVDQKSPQQRASRLTGASF